VEDPESLKDNFERFIWELKEVSKPTLRVKIMLFCKTFDDNFEEKKQGLKIVENAIECLLDDNRSRCFRALLHRTLAIFNYMNGTEEKGFKLSALKLMKNTKSAGDKNYSLLDFVVRDVREHVGGLADFVDELNPLDTYMKADPLSSFEKVFDDLSKQVKQLLMDLKRISKSEEDPFVSKLHPILEKAKDDVSTLSEEYQALVRKATAVQELYCEGSDPKNLGGFFQQIIDFRTDWQEVVKKIEEESRRRSPSPIRCRSPSPASGRRTRSPPILPPGTAMQLPGLSPDAQSPVPRRPRSPRASGSPRALPTPPVSPEQK